MPASITVQRAALFAGAAMSKAHVTGRANTWSGATMINRRLLIWGKPQTYSILEIHVDEADGGHISAARVEIAYDGKSNIANTDNNGIALFSNIPTGTEITYNISKLGYNTASGTWIIDTDFEYETEYVVLSPLVNYDFELTIGHNPKVEPLEYQLGFFINNYGRISPAQFMQHTIQKVGLDAFEDFKTGLYIINRLTVALTGDTRSAIRQITIYVADSTYTLNNVTYNGAATYYYIDLLDDTTVLDYFDRSDEKTVDIQLIDE